MHESGTETPVWYAVYGSNLLRDRFLCYLEGRAPAPNVRAPARCISGTRIQGDQPFPLKFELYFARKFKNWGGGGVAFVGIREINPSPTLGRAYLLTLSQFTHVAKEENGGKRPVSITNEVLTGTSPATIEGADLYRILLPCGFLDEIPVVTLTGSPEQMMHRNPPSELYLSKIRAGLRETYPSMPENAIDAYLRNAGRS